MSVLFQHAGQSLCIDSTEVTFDQYADFLKNGQSQPGTEHARCGWNTDYMDTSSYIWKNYVNGVYAGAEPVRGIDWCDAFAYCAYAGKWLCGSTAPGGGTVADADFANGQKDAWYRVCSGGIGEDYPYATPYDATKCNTGVSDPDWEKHIAPVGSFAQCHGDVPVFDLSGNLQEYSDNCDTSSADGSQDACRLRGGTLFFPAVSVSCSAYDGTRRDGLGKPMGGVVTGPPPGVASAIRCCGPNPQ